VNDATRTPVAVIDDLGAPRFDDEIQAILESVAPMADLLALEVEPIVEQARGEVGLDDLGPGGDGVRARLAQLLAAYSGDAELSPMGVVSIHTLLLQLMRNRLLVHELLRRHPEIHEIEITAPIVIAGLPRTGTTHLHNLLAADPALRSLPYWESLEPVARPGDPPDDPSRPDGPSTLPRIERAAGSLDFVNAALPYLRRMHDMTATHVHEEIQLLAIDVSTMFFETMAPIPSWRDAYLGSDQTERYRYLRTVLQALTFLRGGQRWVLKSPQHLEQFPALLEVFPDAVVVVTHRDPVAVSASMATMVTYTSRLQLARVDPLVVGGYWIDRVGDLLDACTRDRDLLPAARSMDVRFHEFMADDLGTVHAIYELAGQPLDERAQAAHRAYLDGHERDRHGRVAYSLEPFGVDPGELATRHRDYCRRFDVGGDPVR
jgi:hypothetical protein